MKQHMVQCSCRWSLGVTRPQFLLQLARTTFIRYTSHSETFIMPCGVPIAMPSHFWHFSLSQRVSEFYFNSSHTDRYAFIATREYAHKADFRKFCRQLFHSSLECILSPLRPHMSKPRITRCADGHYRCVIYGLGPYIADYPEQALLTCIVQNWCPKCVTIIFADDLLHGSNVLHTLTRCTAAPDTLDGTTGVIPRTHAHTNVLVNGGGVELRELWDDYGIVGDLIVSFAHYLPLTGTQF
jgi:hypothetical protein